MYRIERRSQLYKTLFRALSFSRTIVLFSAVTLILPLASVFAPGSLTVTTRNSTDLRPCMIPTGNLSTPNTPDFLSMYTPGSHAAWGDGVTPMAIELTTKWFVDQRIPDLPQACGPNCRYNMSVPSFVFQCTPNPSSLPSGQAGNPILGSNLVTLWNGTIDSTNFWEFYVAWQSNDPNELGTSGNASCSSFQAQYDVEVRIIALSMSLSLIFLNID